MSSFRRPEWPAAWGSIKVHTGTEADIPATMKIIREYFARSSVDFIGRDRLPSFADCILGCHGSLYRYARSLCGDPWDADELLQETYKRALAARRKPEVASADEIRPWVFTIMRHIWQNERRRVSRSQEMQFEDELPSVPDEGAEQALSRELLLSDVRAAVDSLPVPVAGDHRDARHRRFLLCADRGGARMSNRHCDESIGTGASGVKADTHGSCSYDS